MDSIKLIEVLHLFVGFGSCSVDSNVFGFLARREQALFLLELIIKCSIVSYIANHT